MKTQPLYIFLLLLCVLIAGCKKSGCFEEAGSLTRVQRSVMPFHQIDLHDNINLVLTQDTTEAITVEAGSQLIPNIVTTIENNILTIENKVACNWLRRPGETNNVYVSVKNLVKLNYNASGNVTSTNALTGNNIHFVSEKGAGNVNVTVKARFVGAYIHYENADFTLKGHADVCFSYINARGSIDSKDLEVKKMVMEYGGVRDATVYVTEDLNVILYHSGNLYYKGNPSLLSLKTHSTGRLIQLP
jgi:hypothetical protein